MESGRRFLPRSRTMTGLFLAFNGGMLWWFLAERHTSTNEVRASYWFEPVRASSGSRGVEEGV